MSKIKRLCLGGLFIAIILVLSSYLQIPLGGYIRLDLGYAVVMIASLLFGGIYGGIIAFLARILNDFIFSGYISIWWAIGSAFFGWGVGIMYKYFICRIKLKVAKISALAITTIVASFISFVGIVPILARIIIGVDYVFMLSIGVVAAITDAFVALCIGYPVFELLNKISGIASSNTSKE